MKKFLVLLALVVCSVSLTGCDTVVDWTRKTTAWEIGVASSVLGKGDSKKPQEKEPENKPEKETKAEKPESKDGGIVGWTKKTTEWEMREADKVVSDKGSGSQEKEATSPVRTGNTCKIKGSCPSANIRSEPSTKAAIVCRMKGGDSTEVIGEKSGWLNIKLGSGKNGWVSKTLVEYTTP